MRNPITTIILFATIGFGALPAVAETEVPAEPEAHAYHDFMVIAEAERDTFNSALTAHANLAEAIGVFDEAHAALEIGIADGVATPEMLQARVEAQADMAAKQQAFDEAMALFGPARQALETMLAENDAVSSLAERVTALEEAEPAISGDAFTELMARMEALETENEALRTAICAGHDYDHEHVDAYHDVCHPQTDGEVTTHDHSWMPNDDS